MGGRSVLESVLHNPWYIALYLGGCIVVMLLARRRRRSALLFLGISFFLTPLVGLLTVLLVGPRYWTGMPPPQPFIPFSQPPPVPASAAYTPPSTEHEDDVPPNAIPRPLPNLPMPPVPASAFGGRFWVVVRGEAHGPYTERELRDMFDSGLINARSLGWRDGLDDWRPLRTVEPEFTSL